MILNRLKFISLIFILSSCASVDSQNVAIVQDYMLMDSHERASKTCEVRFIDSKKKLEFDLNEIQRQIDHKLVSLENGYNLFNPCLNGTPAEKAAIKKKIKKIGNSAFGAEAGRTGSLAGGGAGRDRAILLAEKRYCTESIKPISVKVEKRKISELESAKLKLEYEFNDKYGKCLKIVESMSPQDAVNFRTK